MLKSKLQISGMLILFLMSSLFLYDCKLKEQVVQDKIQSPEKGLLWRISGNSLDNDSYLFGTIHMIPAEQFFLPKGTEDALNASGTVFFEVDMAKMDDPMEQMQLFQKSMMSGDLTLRDLLSKEEYIYVKEHFAEIGIPIFILERIKPMFLTVFADNSINPTSLQDGSYKVYELELMGIAQKGAKSVKGLESLDFQMGLMDSIPYEEQALMLVESIKGMKEGSSQLDTLVDLYVNQEIGLLYSSFASDSISVYDSLLLINRNRNWIPIMEESMKNASCFYAVGAAHLAGPNGVIRLLEQKGYKLEAVLEE